MVTQTATAEHEQMPIQEIGPDSYRVAYEGDPLAPVCEDQTEEEARRSDEVAEHRTEGYGKVAFFLMLNVGLILTAVAMVLMALWLRRALPTSRHPQPMPYTQVLRSMGQLLRTQPALRLRTTASALAFASVSVMFATMALVLSSAPLHLSDAQIGLVGLAGVTGALIANMAGSWADKGKGNALLRLGAVTLLLSWWLLWQGQSSVWWFVAGVLVMDLGLQAINVTNQSSVASLLPEARSRMNAVYMTGYFAGASAGSALGVWAWNLAGWQGACSVGAGLALLAAISVWCGVRWNKKQQSAAVQTA